MRCVVQRVTSATCQIDSSVFSEITEGLLVLVGFRDSDDETIIDKVCDKIINLRVLSDDFKTLNFSPKELNKSIMVIPNFTLYGDTKHGRRPSFKEAGDKLKCGRMYEYMIKKLKESDLKIAPGVYGADMKLFLVNDGPVTLIIEEEAKEI